MNKLVKTFMFSMLAVASITMFSCNAQVPKADLKNNLDSIAYSQGVLSAAQIDQLFADFNIKPENQKDYINGFIKGMKAAPKSDKQKAEAMGKWMGEQFSLLIFPTIGEQMFQDSTISLSTDNFTAGYIASIDGPESTLIKAEEAQMYMMMAIEEVRRQSLEKNNAEAKAENAAFLEKNAKEEGVVTLPSGLQYKVISEGKGAKPAATDEVTVHYHGTTIKGEVFDSSVDRGEPATFPLNAVIPGWTEGLQLMPVGSKYMFYIPYDLAYGAEGRGGLITPFATLVFEVELLDIKK
ncbi:FKBP-type peptidyl-prolyl cis-trans isomerase FklB [Dysgonomonadaceae bacterium PH5-43]|nr:FKBP-type peptidyl-prolyl cis-trans isomerase FklB [Dysgonomonadaceae bacterium PH5-43]